MKREGRQHGTVRTYPFHPTPLNPQPNPKNLGGPSLAGPFMRVTTKPTNHSKYTAKGHWTMFSECHEGLTPKPREKTHGAQRVRWSSDIVADYKLTVDVRPNVKLSGFSATNILNYLDQEDDFMDHYEDEEI